MKAEINKDGRLTVYAETEVEAYAMKMWASDNINCGAIQLPNLLFDASLNAKTGCGVSVNKD